jgi:purine-cytosine permease-like protein
MSLGVAMRGAIKRVSAFSDAYDAYGGGGVALEMLSPAGGFGKFVAIILAFSVIGNMVSLYSIPYYVRPRLIQPKTATMYPKSVQFQGLIPIFAKVPRFYFTIIIAAVAVGVAIPISSNLQSSLINFLSLVGYWVSMYVGVFATEHFYFRKGDTTSYDASIWNVGSKLPLGAAGLIFSILPIGLIVPSMANGWYIGPIGKHTGDIGLELGLVCSVLCYLPLRTLEKRMTGR